MSHFYEQQDDLGVDGLDDAPPTCYWCGRTCYHADTVRGHRLCEQPCADEYVAALRHADVAASNTEDDDGELA